MRNASRILLLALLGVAGCAAPDIQYSMSDAKDTFKSRQLNNEDAKEQTSASQDSLELSNKPRRKLIQFRYGPQSLADADFQAFLKRLSSESVYVSDITGGGNAKPLTDKERANIAFDRADKRRQVVLRDMRKMQAQLNSYGLAQQWAKLQPQTDLTFRATPLTVALRKLADQTGATIQQGNKIKSSQVRVSGNYQGNALAILQQMSRVHGFEVRYGTLEQELWVLSPKEAASTEVMASGLVNPLVNVVQSADDLDVLSQYRELVTMLSNGQTDRFHQSFQLLSSPVTGGVLSKAYEDLSRAVARLNQQLQKFDADTQAMQGGFMRTASLNEGEISPAVMARGLMDRNVCPGQELITEKLFVYQEAPTKVMEFLEGYFNANDTRTLKVTKTDDAEDAPAGEVAKAPAAVASSATSAPTVKAAIVPSAKEATAANADRCASDSTKSSFKVIKDPTGVIVTGSVQQIELAARLADDVDIATKQVLAEVFLVEVQKNWERTIQTKIGAGNTSRAFSIGAVGNVVDAATLATAKGINGAQGKFTASSPDITGFINLLETNAVGRNISSPTLIAKNGEVAEINKVITLRKTLTTSTPQPAASPLPAVPNQQVKELQVPLKLKIKPIVNIHNKHVTLEFAYEETSLNADPADSPIEKGTTKNSINTTLETAPGDVVVLAGLFKESNSKSTNSIPGGSGLGIVAPLLGGSNAVSTLSTELLVFIKPTVVEPRANLSQANTVR